MYNKDKQIRNHYIFLSFLL